MLSNNLLLLRPYLISMDEMSGHRRAPSKGKSPVAVDVLQGQLDT